MEKYVSCLVTLAVGTITYLFVGQFIHYIYKVKMNIQRGKLDHPTLFKIYHRFGIAIIKSRTGRRYYRKINSLTWFYYFFMFSTSFFFLYYWALIEY